MGYGAQANIIIKTNRALLKKKRTFKKIKDSYVGYVNDADLKFKELSSFEQQKIRDIIIAKAKRERIYQVKMSFVTLFLLIGLIYGFYYLPT